jgi:catechol 2,3-dioxygenase-like lactoylglutathione lyase family enzyme
MPDHDSRAAPRQIRSSAPPIHASDLEFLRHHAKALLRDYHRGDSLAATRLRTILPTLAAKWDGVPQADVSLSHAQFVLARELGFSSWPKLQHSIAAGAATRSSSISQTKEKAMNTPTSTNSLGLSAIDQIGMSCTDLDAAQKFYCDILGLRYGGELPGMAKFFDCAGVNIIMFKGDKPRTENSVIYFRVEGTDGAIQNKVELLKQAGVKIDEEPKCIARNWRGYDVWLAFFRDPFGNLLSLKSDVPVK